MSYVLVLALVAGVALGAVGKEIVDLRQEKTVVKRNDVEEELDVPLLHLRAGRQKRSGAPNCGGCTRQWAAQRACFSYTKQKVRIPVLCKEPVTERRCWKTKIVRHLVQRCCSGYHAEGIYCHIDCGGCHETTAYWQYACRKRETFYRSQKYICDFGETTRYCIRQVPFTVLTNETFCCDGYVKDRGYCRQDVPYPA